MKISANSKLIIYALILLPLFAEAQGLILSENADTTPYLPLYSGRKGDNNLPARIIQNYRPTPDDQGESLSCTTFAAAYGAYSMLQAMFRGQPIQQNRYSAAFTFNQIPNAFAKGAQLTDVLKEIKTKGVCRTNTFENKHILDRKTPPYNAIEEAKNLLFPLEYTNIGLTVADIKQSLSLNLPVIIGVKVEKNFRAKYMNKANAVWLPETNAASFFHAMLVVDFDESDKSFEILNSYGPNWGRNGFIKIKQTDLVNANVLKEAFILMRAAKPSKGFDMDVSDLPQAPLDLEKQDNIGMFYLENLIGKGKNTEGGDSLIFESTAVRLNEETKVYEPYKKNRYKGEIFQFTASKIPIGCYLYTFSLDPTNKVTIHWPPDARCSETDKQAAEYYAPDAAQKPISAVILSPHIQLTIPSPNEGLKYDKVGEDKLITLIASQPIPDFKQRLDRFGAVSGDVWERLNSAFGNILIPKNRINYFDNKMMIQRFTHEKQGWVAPMVLAISVK